MDDQRKQKIQASGKEIYDNILIPPELDEVVKKMIESKDKESIDKQYKESQNPISEIMKYIGAAAAVIIVSIIVGLNSSESFAKEMGEVPVLGAVAKVFTVRKYTVEREEITMKIDVPHVEITTAEEIPNEKELFTEPADNETGNQEEKEDINTVSGNDVSGNTVSGNESEPNTHVTISGNDIVSVTGNEKTVIDTLTPPNVPMTVSGNEVYSQAVKATDFMLDINKKIDNYVQKYISDETKRFEEYKKAFFESGGTQEEWGDRRFDIQIGYEVKYQKGAVVSFVITANENWCAAYGERTFYNLDMLNGKNIVLSDLLGKDFAKVANVQIVRQMQERVKENPDYVYWGVTDEDAVQGFDGFTTVDENTNFYINAAGNPVIVFEKYEVGPGFMGEQEFEMIVEYDYTPD